MKVLGVIPARGGSKRIPDKNLKFFNGKPLIAWTILEAQKSEYIDDLVVSTDSKKIAYIAEELGCEVIMRPDEISGDTASSWDAVKQVLSIKKGFEFVVLLQPTSPQRTVNDIDNAINMTVFSVDGTYFKKNGAIYIMPVERSIDIDTLEDWERAEDFCSELQPSV